MGIDTRFLIGYAIPANNLPGMFSSTFLEMAESRAIGFVRIDTQTALEVQGPFNAILHKIYDEDWYEQLSRYQQAHPNVVVIDQPTSIERLHNRLSMLEAVTEMQIGQELEETVGIPLQFLVNKSEDINSVAISKDLKFPYLAKPLLANGSVQAHAMSLIFNEKGLQQLEVPVILQQFVNHGGVLFKVYVAGNYSKCVVRASLPDVVPELDDANISKGAVSFNQISNTTMEQSNISLTELPSTSFISELAEGLRRTLALNLFNFDLIRDSKARNRYFIIDINYFPGFEKAPGYESMMTNFFYEILEEKATKISKD